MARQTLGPKKVDKLRRQTGLPVVAVLVRGGTEHRKDLCLADGSVVHLYSDGTLERSDLVHSMTPPESRPACQPKPAPDRALASSPGRDGSSGRCRNIPG